MSFGFSVTDVTALVKVTWTTVQNCRKACGEYDELTQQVQSLHAVLKRLNKEASKPKSLLHHSGDSCWDELRPSLEGTRNILKSLNAIVSTYASINKKDTALGRLWTRAKFGNKELDTLNDLRHKTRFYTGSISAVLNVATVGSLSRIESKLDKAGLEDLKPAIENFATKLAALHHQEGTVLTNYTNDDTAVWKELRRELVKENVVPSDIISKNKDLIAKFIRRLGEQGVLDDSQIEDQEHGTATKKAAGTQNDAGMVNSTESLTLEHAILSTPQSSQSNSTGWKRSNTAPLNKVTGEESLNQHQRARETVFRDIESSLPFDSLQDPERNSQKLFGTVSEESSDGKKESRYQYFKRSSFKLSDSDVDDESPNAKNPPAFRKSASFYAAIRDSSSELDDYVSDAPEKPRYSLKTSERLLKKASVDALNGSDNTSDSSHQDGTSILSAHDYQKSRFSPKKDNVPDDVSSKGDIFGDITVLTSKDLLRFEIEHTMPEVLTNSMLSAPSCYFDLNEFTKDKLFVHFLSTPWGLCLIVANTNLSLLLEHFKILFTIIQHCLQSIESAQPKKAEALKSGESRFNLRQVVEKLDTSLREVISELKQECDPVDFQPSNACDSHDWSEVEIFCDKFLQTSYDRFNHKNQNVINVINGRLPIRLRRVSGIISVWVNTYLNSHSEMIRFIINQTRPASIDPSRFDMWLYKFDETHSDEASSTDSDSSDILPEEDDMGDLPLEAESGLESINQKLEVLTQKSGEFINNPASNLSHRERQYLALNEALTREIILELDGLNICNNIRLRQMRKSSIEAAQNLQDNLHAAFQSKNPF